MSAANMKIYKRKNCRYRRNSEINENIAPRSDNVFNFFNAQQYALEKASTHTRHTVTRTRAECQQNTLNSARICYSI